MFWDDDLTDPVSDDVWEGCVLQTARTNTAKLESAFDAKKWDDISTLSQAREALGISRPSMHIKAQPGSPEWAAEVEAVRVRVQGVRGRLVMFPLRFLHGAALEPGIMAQLLVGRRLFQ